MDINHFGSENIFLYTLILNRTNSNVRIGKAANENMKLCFLYSDNTVRLYAQLFTGSAKYSIRGTPTFSCYLNT